MSTKKPDDYSEPVTNLEDLIEAREERTSAFADDVDGLPDLDERADVDVEDALTFPHPHRKDRQSSEPEDVEAPDNDVGFDYQDNVHETLPSDYSEPYSDAMSTEVEDAEVVGEEELHEIGEMTPEDLIYRSAIIEQPEEGPIGDAEEEAA
jgi:hypothetical protein